MRFTVCDIKCNNYNSHTLRNGVLNALNPYYDGFEYTLYRKLEETTFNLYYVNVPKELLTNDLLHQLHIMVKKSITNVVFQGPIWTTRT